MVQPNSRTRFIVQPNQGTVVLVPTKVENTTQSSNTCDTINLCKTVFSCLISAEHGLLIVTGLDQGHLYYQAYLFVSVYMREAYITIPDEVEAVVGVDREVTIRCRFGGFQPKDGDSMHSWSISWTKQGGDFSLLTNFAGQIFSKNEDNKVSLDNDLNRLCIRSELHKFLEYDIDF